MALSVWGAEGSSAVDPDHHLRLTVNGQVVLDEQWDDKGWQTFQGQIPAGLLVDGENNLEISLPGVDGAPGESVFVDSLTLDYPRNFVAQAGRLDFTGPAGGVTISGLTGDALLFDMSDPQRGLCWQPTGTRSAGRSPGGARLRGCGPSQHLPAPLPS